MTMLRIISSRVLPNNSNVFGALQLLRFNSTAQIHKAPREFRDVELIGTVHLKPLTLDSGRKILTIRTNDSDNVYKLHRCSIQSQKILSILNSCDLEVGQRVFLKGELRSENYMNLYNKLRQRLQVRVAEIYACNTDKSEANTSESTINIDQNSVCVLSHITKLYHAEQFSVVHLVANRTILDLEGNEKPTSEYFQVFVRDKNLIELLKSDVSERDRIIVNGHLQYKTDYDQNGKSCRSGLIEATNILKVDKFTRDVIEEDVNIVNE
ncbi:uncharacterized protein LOC116342866 [Contarinia nasturtii]|uniref:uncharacterized protein LOC116342866 n=1 Tax=Contarinia nasturtii TaxID=265458 RepID=UPI0012D3E5C6|nr:uncharacterized protein LOC116342866 [Contarinia nasturtii]